MKKLLFAILGMGLFGVSAQAQTGWNWDAQSYYSVNPRGEDQEYYDNCSQIPVYSIDPSVCFEPGWDFGGYFSAMFPNQSNLDRGIGGGFLLSYFFDRNIGLEFNYAAHGQGEARHVGHLNGVYRLPINGCFCGAWAPYAFGGWGFTSNGNFDSLFDVGAGVEIRFEAWGCTALFADYSYNFVEKNLDFSQVRLGFKLPF